MRKTLAFRMYFALALCAAVAQSGPAAADASHDASTRAEADRALDRALRNLVAMPGGPRGVIAIVQRGDERKVHRAGVADIETDQPPGANRHMRVASVAKAFSGAAALSLVSQGVLSLDDTIGEHLPDLPQAWAEVTLRQLLGHTSGIRDFSQGDGFIDAVTASPLDAPPPPELLGYARTKLRFTPGTKYRYSNSDNIIVGLIVGAVTGRPYPRVLKEQVYAPLGLERTSLPRGAELPEPFIHGYHNDPSQDPPEDVSEFIAAGWSWSSGGVVSSPADLNGFIRGYVGGELFDAATRAEQRQVIVGARSEPPGPGDNSAGLAIFRYETRCGTMWGHTGNTLGYTQFAAASGNGQRSATVSINAQITLTAGAPGVFEALRHAEELAVCAAFAR